MHSNFNTILGESTNIEEVYIYIYIMHICGTSNEGGSHAQSELKRGASGNDLEARHADLAQQNNLYRHSAKPCKKDMTKCHARGRSTKRVPPN